MGMLEKPSSSADPLPPEGDAPPSVPGTVTPAMVVVLAASATALVWAYWGPFVQMAKHWWDDPQYSHGVIVPLFSLFLLRARRSMLAGGVLRPSWWGLLILAAGTALRLYCAYY